jgi:hypothetical protein
MNSIPNEMFLLPAFLSLGKYRYMTTLSLSLALLNLLPLPRLDGAHMIEAVLDRGYSRKASGNHEGDQGQDRDGSASLMHMKVNEDGDETETGEKALDQSEEEPGLYTSNVEAEPSLTNRYKRRKKITKMTRWIESGCMGLIVLMIGGQCLGWLLSL